jgi:hypothetical protein
MSKVNQLQAEVICEHNVVWLKVAMSDVINSVQVLNCFAYLAAQILLQPNAEFAPGLGAVVVAGAHQEGEQRIVA